MSYSATAHDRYFEQMENEYMSRFYTEEEIEAEEAEKEAELEDDLPCELDKAAGL